MNRTERHVLRAGGLGASLLIGGLLVAGCSAIDLDRTSCQDDTQCEAVFPGVRATCDLEGGGYCTIPVEGSCVTNADCRDLPEFGFGFVCDQDACVAAAPNPRCAQTFPERLLMPGEFTDPFVFGSIVERAFDGDAVLENAARLAIDQANEADGLDDRVFGMVFCDMSEDASLDSLSIDEAAEATATYLQDTLGVPAIHGPTTSGTTELVFEALRDTNTLLISPSATSPDLTLLDVANASDAMPGLLWRTVPPDSLQGQTIAEDLGSRSVTTVVVVTEAGSYGVGLQNFFVDVFRAAGGAVAGELLQFSSTAERDAALVTAAAALEADQAQEILFISGEISDTIEFLNTAASNPAFTPTMTNEKGIFLTDTSKTGDIFTETRPEVLMILDRVRLTAPAPGGGAIFDTFAGAYSARFPENPRDFGFLPQAYDATWLMIYGAAWAHFQQAGIIGGENIARGLRRISAGTGVDITGTSWTAVRSAFGAGSPIDVTGASGGLDYDPVTEELLTAPIDVLAIQQCMGEEPAFVAVGPGGTLPACP